MKDSSMANNPHRPIRKICVVGGGTAGWMAAALMSEHFKGTMGDIEVVESDDISTVGVGESTVPPLRELIAKLGINEQEFIRETQGTFKLGIDFRDWRVKGENYFHPFGVIGSPVDLADFYQLWLKAKANGYQGRRQTGRPLSAQIRRGARRKAHRGHGRGRRAAAQRLRREADPQGRPHDRGRLLHRLLGLPQPADRQGDEDRLP
jgi:hypothetical protein